MTIQSLLHISCVVRSWLLRGEGGQIADWPTFPARLGTDLTGEVRRPGV